MSGERWLLRALGRAGGPGNQHHLIKWSLDTIFAPLDASIFQVKPWKPRSPKLNLPTAEMPLWWLTFGMVHERTWPPCFGLFSNLSAVVLAVPITWYQSLVLLWILLTIWPLQCFWQGPFASSCATYSYLIFLPFKAFYASGSFLIPFRDSDCKHHRLFSS